MAVDGTHVLLADETEIGDLTQHDYALAGYYQAGASSVTMSPTPQSDYYAWGVIAYNVNAAAANDPAPPRPMSLYHRLRAV